MKLDFIPVNFLSLDLTKFRYGEFGGHIFHELQFEIKCNLKAEDGKLHFTVWALGEVISEESFRMHF